MDLFRSHAPWRLRFLSGTRVMNVLGIETSCDETSAAVVCHGRDVLSNVVFSQAGQHAPYGGVVPELAARSHVEVLPAMIDEALARADCSWPDIDLIAVTYGPGLASSLLVGLAGAKALACRIKRPLVGINHLEAHIYSAFLGPDRPAMADTCPFLALVVSGGHTMLVEVRGLGDYVLLGQTIDDAAGEAFDKGANLLGLGYPGGPMIDKVSRTGDPRAVRFPRGRLGKDGQPLAGLDPELCFSYSGLKTALLYHLKKHPLADDDARLASVAASYQEAIVDALVDRCRKVVGHYAHLVVVGGVSLNSRLREKLARLAKLSGVSLFMAEPCYCTDNAAMVAGLAGTGRGIGGEQAFSVDARPNSGLT